VRAPGEPSWYDDLGGTLEHAWALLARGVADRHSGFHTLQVATIGPDGAPRLRTVVLRGVDVSARTIRFHTDARSPKVEDIAADPRVALHLYDKGTKIQLRLTGTARVHREGAVADAAWAGTRDFSRICYRVARAPGEPIPEPRDGLPPTGHPDAEAGREAFRVVVTHVATLEWLYLAHAGHRRALFSFDGANPAATWLVP
jgi:hypothetical protein